MKKSSICPKFEKAVSIISQRWTGLIVYQLIKGPQRFSYLESTVGMSGRVLSERLKELEMEGIVKREVFPETPVRIEYSLTEKGISLQPIMNEISKWAETWVEKQEASTHEELI